MNPLQQLKTHLSLWYELVENTKFIVTNTADIAGSLRAVVEFLRPKPKQPDGFVVLEAYFYDELTIQYGKGPFYFGRPFTLGEYGNITIPFNAGWRMGRCTLTLDAKDAVMTEVRYGAEIIATGPCKTVVFPQILDASQTLTVTICRLKDSHRGMGWAHD